MLAILMAVQWTEQNNIKGVIVCSDSLSALVSLQSFSSHCRADIVYEIYETLYRLHHSQTKVRFMWIPAHRGIEGNEMADSLAKQSQEITMEVTFSKGEAKTMSSIMTEWQKQWD